MAEIASAFVSILPSARGFGRSLDAQVSGGVAASGKKAGVTWGRIFGVGAALAVGAKAVRFLGDSLAEGREAEKVAARTDNVIKSMGLSSKVTSQQVGNLATAISNKTGIDDEQIQSTANLLLGFKDLGKTAGVLGGHFDRATGLATDMAAALDKSAKSGAIQLGRALQDPVKGLTTLTRAGVSFTAQQTEQVKELVASGQTMKAQGIILDEVGKKFGGAAAAMANPSEKATVAVDNLKEQIGTALIPVVDSASSKFTNDIAPAISKFITGMQDGTGAGGTFKDGIDKIGSAVSTTAGFLNEHRSILVTLAAAYTAVKVVQIAMAASTAVSLVWLKLHTVGTIENTIVSKAAAAASKAWAVAQWLLNAALTANPIGLIVIAIAALVAGLIIAYKKSETFRNIVDGALTAVGKAFTFLWNNVAQPVLKFLVEAIAAVMNTFANMVEGMSHVPGFGWLGPLADKMHDAADKTQELANNINKIHDKTVTITVNINQQTKNDTMLGDTTPKTTGGKYGRAFGAGLAEGLKPGLDKSSVGFDNWSKIAAAKIEKLKGRLDTLRSALDSVASSVASAFTPDTFGGTGTDLLNGLFSNVGNLNAVTDAFNKLKGIPGVSPAFLSALFASGNTGLILELANTFTPEAAALASSLFDQQGSLSASLGQQVGINQFGDKITEVRDEIKELRKDVTGNADRTAVLFAAAINAAASTGRRDVRPGRPVWAAA